MIRSAKIGAAILACIVFGSNAATAQLGDENQFVRNGSFADGLHVENAADPELATVEQIRLLQAVSVGRGLLQTEHRQRIKYIRDAVPT